MKKHSKSVLYAGLMMAIVMLSGAFSVQAASPFKGTITYKITYTDSKMDAAQQAMMPQFMKVLVNGNKARLEMTVSGISQTFIIDADAKSTTILLDMMGQKVALKPNKDNVKAEGREPIIEIKDEVKEIAGYSCKKAEIHFGDSKSKEEPIIVYYSEALGTNKFFYDNEYRNLPGIPMEFLFKLQGMSMYLTALNVEKGKVSNKDFEIPSGYSEMTPEQLRQLFGGH